MASSLIFFISFEVLKYSTLLQKAALRNSVFFNKLF